MRMQLGNRRGQAALLFSLMLVPMLGMLGLVVDVGWAYYRLQAAQAAADAAASAAGVAASTAAGGGGATCSTSSVSCNTSYSCPASPSTTPSTNLETGCLYAKQNGFVNSGKQKVIMQSGVGSAPTASGVTISYWVIARVSENIPQLFSAVLGFPSTTITARATTGTRDASAGGCIITLNPNAAGALSGSGTTSITSGCGVFVNSNNAQAITLNGGASITTNGTARTQIVGNCSGCSNISPLPQTGVGTMVDPFADLNPPPVGNCTTTGLNLGSHDHQTINPGVYCGGINLGAQSQLTLNPGVYVVKADAVGNAISMGGQTTMTGTGVTIYIQSGGVSMSGGASVSLTAPSSGLWQGILFYQDRADTTPSTLVGGTGQLMNGVLYFPKANLTYTGGSGINTNATATTIVSDTLTMVGDSFINAAAVTQFTGTTGGSFLIE